jgi:rhodanese-related sulfurtransferase
MSAMEIGLFQLENLCSTPSRFQFFDLRANPVPVHKHIDILLKKATAERPAHLPAHLKAADKAAPVVLVCENGKTSEACARDLEAAGFTNVYVIAGGVEGLLSELGLD